MTEATVYQWSWIAQGTSVAVEVEGWSGGDRVTYQATPYPLGPDVYPANLVLVPSDRALRHDGSATDTTAVHNDAPFHPCAMVLRATWDAA